jgi:hypothetical protein
MMRRAPGRPTVEAYVPIANGRSDMTDTPQAQKTSAPQVPPQTRGQEETGREAPRRRRETPPRESSAWAGWIVFGALMLIMVGTFQVLMGLTAVFQSGYYEVGEQGLLVEVDYTVWGWTHVAIGALAVAAAFGLFVGKMWARVSAIVLAALGSVVQLGFLSAAPLWSMTIITLNVLVIYAVAVYGADLEG